MGWKDNNKKTEYNKKYYNDNLEYFKEYRKQYYETNKYRIISKSNNYYKDYFYSLKGRSVYLRRRYKRMDLKNGFEEPNITVEQIMDLIQQPCHWCGQTDWSKNGIDRLDNSKGHNIDNVVCSCWVCNNKRAGISNGERYSKPVLQYTKDGEFIAEYKSTMDAYRKTGIDNSGISKCCLGKQKTAGGFVFKYKEVA